MRSLAWFTVAILGVHFSPIFGRPWFRDRIPNGYNVTNPCNTSDVWKGVGHFNSGGGGPRNDFGQDFAANNFTWTPALCNMDSDGDGKTNGQELGDPDCVWVEGDTPSITDMANISHPGICEPKDSLNCQDKFYPICDEEFSCDAMEEAGVIVNTVQLIDTAVPAQETTYMCIPVQFPNNASYHLIAVTPYIDNIDVTHHAILYGCNAGVTFNETELNTSSSCNMPNRNDCRQFIALWAIGMEGYCFNPEAGLLIGDGGFEYAILEVHWDNPGLVDTFRDGSGLNLYLTPNLRNFNASVLMIGQTDLVIPPGQPSYTFEGRCDAVCTQKNRYMTGPVNIFAAFNHMHVLGIAGHTKLKRPDNTTEDIAYDQVFSFNSPVFHSFDPITMNKGDQLSIQCTYGSMSRDTITRYGDSTSDEMCFGFVFYYPAENIKTIQCVSDGASVACKRRDLAVHNNCDFPTAVNITITVAQLGFLTSPTFGHPFYQERIPNGRDVPHPCNKYLRWNGVGHENRGGGGKNNPFGLDFAANGHVWDSVLCEKDSDGDGISNGVELGDPNCVWRAGSNMIPEITEQTRLSHPGICEPENSENCRNKFYPDCNKTEFRCDAMEEQGVIKHTMRLKETKVPNKETTYMCMPVAFPDDAAYHLVAMTPNISNIFVMHHAILYGCSDRVTFEQSELNNPSQCFMGNRDGCNDFIAIWALGIDGYCFHPNAGILLGKAGYKYAVIELHWNNPEQSDKYLDSSGLNLYITKTLRPYNASVLMIGETDLQIPPLQHNHVVEGNCAAECTQDFMAGPVNIFAATNHMHYLGKSGHSRIIRPDSTSQDLAYDLEYSYDSPAFHSYDPIVMNPGDQLTMQCNYRTMTKSKTTYFGEETMDEMCYAFLFYYPAENIRPNQCVSHGPYQTCSRKLTVYNGCDFTRATSTTDPAAVARYTMVTSNCARHSCLKECLEVVRLINQDPCYGDDNNRRLMKQITYEVYQYSEDVLSYWILLDSCEKQLALDSCPRNDQTTGGVSHDRTTDEPVQTCVATDIPRNSIAALVFLTALVTTLNNFI